MVLETAVYEKVKSRNFWNPEDEDENLEDTIMKLSECRLQLGVTVHEFMLISICQCLCHIMKVSWSQGFIGFVVSIVSWFHKFRGVNGFMLS